MEGTAMFMEDQVRGRRQRQRQLPGRERAHVPSVPVDRGSGGFEYGAWIWWRFLMEEVGSLQPGRHPQEWERVAAASTDTDGPGPDNTANDLYSLQGLRKVASANGHPFADLYGKFAWANRLPFIFYERGRHVPDGKGEEDVHARAPGHGQRLAIAQIAPSQLQPMFGSYPGSATPANAVLRVGVRPSRSRGFPEGLRAREGRRPAVERAQDRAERHRERGAPRRIRPRRRQGSRPRSDECEHAHALRSQHVLFVHRGGRGRPTRLCLPRHGALTERWDVDKLGSGLAQRVDQLR